MKRELTSMACLCLLTACTTERAQEPPSEAPYLRVQGESAQLLVDGEPFLMLAGELGNSTASDLRYLREFWPRLEALHLNTVLAPVYWELIEPQEGRFDLSLVDGLIEDARAHDMRLVLLWFGSWKNSMSCYAPAWVKRDQERFPRSRLSDGRALEILSPFDDANRDADAAAFAALMRHLREVDEARRTVLMVQVENQVFDVWRAAAPSLDFLAPDIYFPNFVEWARAYDIPDNAFFVPETGRQPEATPANAFYAFGAHDAMGFSPFAIESYSEDDRLGDAYAVLEGLAPLILEHQGTGTMAGVRPVVAFDGTVDETPQDVHLGDFTLHVRFVDPFTPRERQTIAAHGGLIIRLGPGEYLVAGRGLTVTFSADEGLVGIEGIWEGAYRGGNWVPGRRMNGDQSHQGRHLHLPPGDYGVQRVRLYRYS